jgi:hypothetical protein
MKNLFTPFLLLLVILSQFSYGQSNQKASSGNGIVEVYYFHNTIRCVTCKTVEAEARKNIEMLYPEHLKSGKINFTVLNIDEDAGRSVGSRLGINSQTLIIVKGDKKINITNDGFLYAVSNPEKFKDMIKEKIDPLIK